MDLKSMVKEVEVLTKEISIIDRAIFELDMIPKQKVKNVELTTDVGIVKINITHCHLLESLENELGNKTSSLRVVMKDILRKVESYG